MKQLKPLQICKVVQALLDGATRREAAKAGGVSERDLHRLIYIAARSPGIVSRLKISEGLRNYVTENHFRGGHYYFPKRSLKLMFLSDVISIEHGRSREREVFEQRERSYEKLAHGEWRESDAGRGGLAAGWYGATDYAVTAGAD